MTIETIDLNLLMVLHHALVERSVVRAAERLHVTPSAISNSLAKLRDLFGDPLLVRHGRGLVPTPRAEALVPRVAALATEARGVFETTRPFEAATCTRRFTLASADNIGIVAQIAERFSRRLPRASLRIVTLDYALSNDTLASGDVDVLLGIPPQLPPDHRSEPAYTERLVCAMWRGNTRIGKRLTLQSFLRASHIEIALQGTNAIDYVDIALAQLGQRRSISVSVPHFATAAMCLEGTPHIAMLPKSMAQRLAHSLPLRLCEPPLSLPAVTIMQVWHTRTDGDPATVLFRSVIREAGRQKR